MKKVIAFCKRETVLTIAFCLAVVSSFVVLPDKEYINYIDFRTLSLLFCLMGVMAGFQKIGVFRSIAGRLLEKVRSVRTLVFILIGLCFFFSMFITNDVALITFVPFTFLVLDFLEEELRDKLFIPVVVFQTIAANLGSMFTPIGNPQNLYLYGKAGWGIGEFLLIMAPYTGLSLFLLILFGWRIGGMEKQGLQVQIEKEKLSAGAVTIGMYLALFLLCLLTVVRVLPYYVCLGIALVVFVLLDCEILKKIDYCLLLTFVCFFVFIGNMGRIPAFSDLLSRIVEGNEVYCGVAFSQCISNVPAALLLSGFSDGYQDILIGVNLGGLGTLIASMASLISYKLVAVNRPESKGKYLKQFTLWNIVFLIIIMLFYLLLR